MPKNDPKKQLLAFLKEEHPGDAGIVYCLSRASVDRTAEFRRNGVEAVPYHAGLDAGTRAAHQSRFLREEGLVVVATIAFGMGIDKPDVVRGRPGPAEIGGRVLPGDRPRRARRTAVHRLDDLRPAGRRAAAEDDPELD